MIPWDLPRRAALVLSLSGAACWPQLDNPDSCRVNAGSCAAGQRCDQVTGRCIAAELPGSWRRADLSSGQDLFAVGCSAARGTWIGGDRALLAKREGEGWAVADTAAWANDRVSDLWVSADVWAFSQRSDGSAGVLRSRPGEAPAAVDPNTRVHLGSPWSPRDDLLFLTWGTSLYSLRPDAQFYRVLVPVTAIYNGIGGSDDGNGFAVGQGGVILHWGGKDLNDWTQMPSPTTGLLRSVYAPDRGDGWITGDGGTVLRLDGGAWRTYPSPAAANLRSSWGAGATDVWMVGEGGTVLHFDGSALQRVSVPTTAPLYGVYGCGPLDVWAVGLGGTVLHYGPR